MLLANACDVDPSASLPVISVGALAGVALVVVVFDFDSQCPLPVVEGASLPVMRDGAVLGFRDCVVYEPSAGRSAALVRAP